MPAHSYSEIQDAVSKFIGSHFPQFAGEAVGEGTELLTRGLDSLAVLDLMTFLAERFHLELDEEDFAAEHFETVGTLSQLVRRKLG